MRSCLRPVVILSLSFAVSNGQLGVSRKRVLDITLSKKVWWQWDRRGCYSLCLMISGTWWCWCWRCTPCGHHHHHHQSIWVLLPSLSAACLFQVTPAKPRISSLHLILYLPYFLFPSLGCYSITLTVHPLSVCCMTCSAHAHFFF